MNEKDYEEKNIDAYNKIADDYVRINSDDSFYKNELDRFVSLLRGKNVLDIGCGMGRDSLYFLENDFDYTGIDASPGMLRAARKKSPRGKFMLMNFLDLKFKDGEFDGFWAAASFLHVPKKLYPPA